MAELIWWYFNYFKDWLKGFITYTNRDFLKYAGYSVSEILHKNHNNASKKTRVLSLIYKEKGKNELHKCGFIYTKKYTQN